MPDEKLPATVPVNAASLTKSLRDTFSPHSTLPEAGSRDDPLPPTVEQILHNDGQLVLTRLDGLVACYRLALTEFVHMQELVEKHHDNDAGRGAADDSLGHSRYLGGGARWLQGCYAEIDGLRATLSSLRPADGGANERR